MTTLHIVSGGKGSVGKSAFASMLVCIARKSNHNPVLIDADRDHKTLSRLHGESVFAVVLSDDPALDSQPDQIWAHIEERYDSNKADVIVDLAAQADPLLSAWMDEKGVIELAKDLKVPIYKWWVSNLKDLEDGDKNREEIIKLCQKDKAIIHVLVKNHTMVKPEMWDAYIESNDDLKGVIEEGLLKQIVFPRLSSNLLIKLRQDRVTYETADKDVTNKLLNRISRSTIVKWIEKSSAGVQTVYKFPPLDPKISKKSIPPAKAVAT